MTRVAAGLVMLTIPALVRAAPYVAYVGNVPVHSPSPDAKIMVVDLAGGAGVDVSDGLGAARSPAWAPDGAKLAFEAIQDGLNDIFVCTPDGSGRQNVTHTPEVWESAPAFAGNGHLILLEGPDQTQVCIVDLGTGESKRLTAQPAFHGTPVASPDGKLVAVTVSEKLSGPGDILLLQTDGAGLRNLTQAPAIYSTPCFSPDGSSVAFCFGGRDIGGAARGLAIMPVAGGEPLSLGRPGLPALGEPRLLADDGYPLAPLCFSPDGSRIAYTSASGYHSTWVSIVNVDGSGKQRLDVGSAHVIGWPSFSSGGDALAYQAVLGARYTVRLLNLRTGETRVLTPEGETGVNPVFSPR
jgi:Tol biopolymer transport system component